MIEAHGGKVSGSVSKKTNYLLAGENDFDEDDEETEVVETEQTEQEDDNL